MEKHKFCCNSWSCLYDYYSNSGTQTVASQHKDQSQQKLMLFLTCLFTHDFAFADFQATIMYNQFASPVACRKHQLPHGVTAGYANGSDSSATREPGQSSSVTQALALTESSEQGSSPTWTLTHT